MFHEKVLELDRLSIGSLAPEIALNTPDGKSIALSSLKGKVVLIDFWASWCRPCRAENPNVVRMYNTYKDKGFDIYSVSLDKDKEAWMKAINDDHLLWPSHVSDLGYWQSSVVKQYNISGIPFTCLIDKEGKIVAKGLRGEELEIKLKELLGIK
jgi:peroxiredoxin